MAKKIKRTKKVKRKKYGWKKNGKRGYVYHFMPSVAKRFGIRRINFPGFIEKPSVYLLASGGGFNLRQSNKVGGGHFLNYLADKFKKRINLTIFSTISKKQIFKVRDKSVTLVISIENFMEILQDLGDDIREKSGEAVENRLVKYYRKEYEKLGRVQEATNTKLRSINLSSL